ncbi:unnamed protein product [Fraxinus pennsylvanica]|uniref:Uncharacterized protein n=1 Tax=Fraxinus pennsylvanica TaxID=56036 RepID=A0AAD1YMN5_9LAMI|nr:unnamed protein product [Fraxinus pennsylvanica]
MEPDYATTCVHDKGQSLQRSSEAKRDRVAAVAPGKEGCFDDSSIPQNLSTPKSIERISFSGKQIPQRLSVVSQYVSDDTEKRSKYRKHTETLAKELVMTSDQASMKNQWLPKGFVYVPIRSLPKDKETTPDSSSQEPAEQNGYLDSLES